MPIFSSSNTSSNTKQFGLIVETTGASSLTVKQKDSIIQTVDASLSQEMVSTFGDQEERNASNVVFARKTSGDQINERNNSKSGINFKNEKVKNIVRLSEAVQQNSYISTNIMRGFDSSKESSHYLYGFKKFIDLKLSYFSATYFTGISGTFKNIDISAVAASQNWNTSVAVSPIDGAVYVCGTEPVTGVGNNFFIKKLDGFAGIQTFSTVDSYNNSDKNGDDGATQVAVSPIDGAVYACGYEQTLTQSYNWVVRRSPDGSSGSFIGVDTYNNAAKLSGTDKAWGIAVSPIDGAVYVCGTEASGTSNSWLVRRSPSGLSGTFSTVDAYATLTAQAYGVAVSPIDGAVYVAGTDFGSAPQSISVRRSPSGLSGTFSFVDSFSGSAGIGASIASSIGASIIAVSPIDGAVYVAGYEIPTTGSSPGNWFVRRSPSGLSGTFSTVDTYRNSLNQIQSPFAIAVSPIDGAVYVVGSENRGSGINLQALARRSPSGLSGTFSIIDSFTGSAGLSFFLGLGISPFDGTVYIAGYADNPLALLRSSRPVVYNSGTISALTGATGMKLQRFLADQNNAIIIDPVNQYSFYNVPSVLGYNKTTVHSLLSPMLKMSISGANGFSTSDFKVKFRDDGSPAWADHTDITIGATYFSSSEPGWINFVYNFTQSPAITQLSMSYSVVTSLSKSAFSIVLSSSAGKIYSFKNIELDFREALTNDGVIYYSNVDNQNNKNIFEYIKAGIVTKVI